MVICGDGFACWALVVDTLHVAVVGIKLDSGGDGRMVVDVIILAV